MGLMLALLVACGGCGGPAVEDLPVAEEAPVAKALPAPKKASPEEANKELEKAFEQLFSEKSGFIKPEDDLFGQAQAKADKMKTPNGVSFGTLKTGDTASSPLKISFEVSGMTIQPAGVMDEGTGHHHLIIDSADIPKGTAIPMDAQHIHYGKGQTSAEIELAPGEHTLTLQFADGMHVSYGPQWSSKVTVTVTE
jgi:hypothetical protein